MTHIKFHPLFNLNFEDDRQSLLDEMPVNFCRSELFLPKIDISEDEKNIYFDVEVPGMKKEDLSIVLENNVLTIKGERNRNAEEKKRNLIRNESAYGSFVRTITIKEEINSDSTSAEVENGILRITIAKASPKSSDERQIKIK